MSEKETRDLVKTAHASMACAAWVFFFPLGAILIRIPAGKLPMVRIHYLIQSFAWLVFAAAFGMGVWLAVTEQALRQPHPIIGIIVFGFATINPILGIIHHLIYKKKQMSTFWATSHIWLGRLVITLGMINGGLGLQLSADDTRGETIAYSVIAGVVWLTWVSVIIAAGARFSKARKNGTLQEKNVSPARKSYETDNTRAAMA